MISIILGIFGLMALCQIFKLVDKLRILLRLIKEGQKASSLLEELHNLSVDEFKQWCLEYMISKKFSLIEKKEGFFIMEKDENKFGVFIVKENLNLDYILKCEALAYFEKLNNITLITLDDLSELTYLNNNQKVKINFIDGNEFDKTYVEYVKQRRINFGS